ncbi:MAG: hypothetical protein CMJ18_19310 [Phycisphaeraceae bacterium]|nr:hypothetical protein [Phycisphaeraceae bacterium]
MNPSDPGHGDELDQEPDQTEGPDPNEEGAERCVFHIRNHVRKRLDSYLQGRLKGISRSRVQKLIHMGGVRVNDAAPKASTIVRRGDRLDVILPPPAIRTIDPEDIPIDILHEDDDLIVINKQADLVVHPARSQLRGTLVNALAHHFKQQQEAAGKSWSDWNTRGFKPQDRKRGAVSGLSRIGAADLRPGVIHRLDKHTTGVMVVAKNDDAHWNLARQFEDRTVLKAYLALVHGIPDGTGGVIDQPIGKHPTYREPYAVRHDSTGKPSVTIYRVRRRYRGYALVELELKTGRTHQIRVHLSYLGWPVVGDIWYGGEPVGETEFAQPPLAAGARRYLNFARDRDEGARVEADALARPDLILARPALHAAVLELDHPSTRQRVRFTAPLHEPMRSLIERLEAQGIEGTLARDGTHVDLGRL